MRVSVPLLLLVLCWVACVSVASLSEKASIPPVVAAPKAIVSGISSGAFAAVQFHVSFSSSLLGAAVIAGGPFYCAKDTEVNALTACMNDPMLIDVPTLVSAAKYCGTQSLCDDPSNLKDQVVYLFSGSKDTVVNSGVVRAASTFYQSFMPASHVVSVIDELPAVHSWVTNSYGNACGDFGSPYIINCQYDAASVFLTAITNRTMAKPGTPVSSHYYSVSQQSYLPAGTSSPKAISMGPDAYVYVPAACAATPKLCTAVVALHGCEMTLSDIGLDFVQHSGLNELAETNNFVVLYPQAIRSSFAPANPEGCWDWWGYTNSNYSNSKGPQMATINNMMQALFKGTLQ